MHSRLSLLTVWGGLQTIVDSLGDVLGEAPRWLSGVPGVVEYYFLNIR